MFRKFYILSIILVVFMASACTKSAPNSADSSATGTLKSAEELMKITDAKNLNGKVTIIDFWATWCPPCKRQIPVLIKLQNKYKTKGFQVIGISIDRPSFRVSNPSDAVKKMVKEFGINYPVGIADDKLTAKFPPFQVIPTAYVYNKQGQRVKTLTGFNSEAALDEIIRELL